jgi:hypothetical protein
MTNYVKSTDFAAKDALASGNASKIVKGTEIDTEFNNIATAVATKADLASPTFTGTPALPSGTTATTQSFGDSSTKLATTAFVQAALQLLYPVGSIYTNSSVSTNPGTLFGFGTWTAFGAGRVMVGLDAGDSSFDTAEETGGSKDSIVVSHTHGVTDSGHNHQSGIGRSGSGSANGLIRDVANNVSVAQFGIAGGNVAFEALSTTSTTGLTVNSAGSSGTNANLQPYITVYMWKRTA